MHFALPVLLVALLATAVEVAGPVHAATEDVDPHAWLEDIDGAAALDWARVQNARSLPVLESDPRFADMRAEARAVLTSPKRIPIGSIHAGYVYNFWQDDVQVRGLWRRAEVAGYLAGSPRWQTLIDFDRLAREENENWIAGTFACLAPAHRRCMVQMSRGGGDASTWREFDTETRSFIRDGFVLPEAKSDVAWVDDDTLLVGTNWGEGSLTLSGYARVVKAWRRGTPLERAVTLYEGQPQDVSVRPQVEQDGRPRAFVVRATTFFESEFYLLRDLATPVRLPLPPNADLEGVLDGRAILRLREAWSHGGRPYASGSVVAYDLDRDTAELVFVPNDAQSVEQVAIGRTGLVLQYLEDVSGRAARVVRTAEGRWRLEPIPLPAHGVLKIASAGGGTDTVLVTHEGLTTPLSLHQVDTRNRVREIVRAAATYDAAGVVVEQRFATSKDGTRIPYFVMGRGDVLRRGPAPTVQYAYGGFLNATQPVYYEDPARPQHGALAGPLWVARGGVLVLANIRGGSEYGPRWHQAGLRENRQKVFDDFVAVSEHLIRTGVTTPRQLGAIGRSNGGLLMGVVMNQRPDLYAAIVCGVPLLDMRNYTRLGAGASWVAEYGDPATTDWNYMSAWSPYQNLRAGVDYPPVFYYTSTRDDRVHPAHARKAAARLAEFGRDHFYYENIEGGHGGTANQEQLAYRIALEYTYFARQLMGAGGGSGGGRARPAPPAPRPAAAPEAQPGS